MVGRVAGDKGGAFEVKEEERKKKREKVDVEAGGEEWVAR